MRDCTERGDGVEGLLFEGLLDRPLEVRFDGERQSDFGGLPLLAAADRRLGLTAALASALHDPRQPGKVVHDVRTLLLQRIAGIAVGREDVNDAALLRDDPTLRMLCGRPVLGEAGALASAPSLCRFENRATPRDLVRLGRALAERVIETQRQRRHGRATRITIDMDPSVDPTYGGQQLTFFNGHYDDWCYLPVFAFLTFHDAHGREEREQHLVAAVLRPGNVTATHGARGLLRRLVARVRRAFPRTAIRVRLDGGYAAGEFLDFLEDLGLEYVVNLPTNARLREVAAEVIATRVRPWSEATGVSQRVFGECRYAAKTWRHERRVVIKAEVVRDPGRPEHEARDNARFVVTNLTASPEHVYTVDYCGRGDIENRIKELKDGLSIDRTSCTSFLANQLRVLLTAAAYVLMQELRHAAARTDLARAQVTTLRERLLLLSARVVESTRQFVVHLSRVCAARVPWRTAAIRLGAART